MADSMELIAWQSVLASSARFTHLTAVAVYGLWLPPLPPGLPVFAAMSDQVARPRRGGLLVSRHPRLPPSRVMDGIRLARPADALLACARDLELVDLIAVIDSALNQGVCTMAELLAATGQRRRGAPRLRKALRFVDGRAESGWESLLRLVHVLCGIDVEPQYVVRDETGGFIARGDLWPRGSRTLHEYDGGFHRDAERHRRDLARDRRLLAAGWTRRGYTSREVVHQAVSILRDADTAIGRRHRPERIRTWHQHLARSLVTPAGRARLAVRVGNAMVEAPPGSGRSVPSVPA